MDRRRSRPTFPDPEPVETTSPAEVAHAQEAWQVALQSLALGTGSHEAVDAAEERVKRVIRGKAESQPDA